MGILALELHWVQSGFLQPLWRWATPTCLLCKVGYTVMQTGPVQDFIKTSLWMDDYFTQTTGLRVNRKGCCQTRNWVSQSQTGGWMFPALLPGLEQSWRNFKGNAFPNKNLFCYTINRDSKVKSVDMDTIISEPVSSRQSSCMNRSIVIVGCIHMFPSKKFKFPKHWLKIASIKNNQLYMTLIYEKQSHNSI